MSGNFERSGDKNTLSVVGGRQCVSGVRTVTPPEDTPNAVTQEFLPRRVLFKRNRQKVKLTTPSSPSLTTPSDVDASVIRRFSPNLYPDKLGLRCENCLKSEMSKGRHTPTR